MTGHPERDLPAPPDGEGPQAVADIGDAEPAAGGTGDRRDPVGVAAEEILTDVAALTAERDEYLAALQRVQADFANYRKRVLRQQEEQRDRAAVDLVTKLLPVLDTLDLAALHLDPAEPGDDPPAEAGALRQARAQLIDTLAKEGLERVDEAGVPFDPAVHDAVAHAPSEEDGEGGGAKIEEVLRAGYRWRGQTLRPAMVRVRG